MTPLYAELGQFKPEQMPLMGSKAVNLDLLIKRGFAVPTGISCSSELYKSYLEQSGLGTWLSLNVEKRPLSELRWEEVWDLSHQIRHKFIKTPFPDSLQTDLLEIMEPFLETSVAVRSSSLGETSKNFSFAGLHDSVVNVQGMYSILEAIREVWSSLWSDKALVYSNRFGLNLQESAMAVIIQELVLGESSGVLSTQNFQHKNQILIETVPGLNENLVSGRVEAEGITIEKTSRKLIDWKRTKIGRDPFITEELINQIVEAGLSLEEDYMIPLDIDWTIRKGELYILQVRPIATESQNLKKSFDELIILKDRILKEFLPDLRGLAQKLSELDVSKLDDQALKLEIARRKTMVESWEKTYIDSFIPLDQGVRLFGEVYSRVIKPESPFEFIDLLVHNDSCSLQRNRELKKMAALHKEQNPLLDSKIETFLKEYGQTSFLGELLFSDRDHFLRLLEKFPSLFPLESESQTLQRKQNLEETFLRSMTALGRDDGLGFLDLARVSYKLGEDDNIAVSKISGELFRAENEWRKRRNLKTQRSRTVVELRQTVSVFILRKRQVTGLCASQGLATGNARVLRKVADLFDTVNGEILVCDFIDPSITFIIPLVSAIVERRGGMLEHGAIIAREYEIPCITGVSNAVEIIHTGDKITVDAYSGIITIHE